MGRRRVRSRDERGVEGIDVHVRVEHVLQHLVRGRGRLGGGGGGGVRAGAMLRAREEVGVKARVAARVGAMVLVLGSAAAPAWAS